MRGRYEPPYFTSQLRLQLLLHEHRVNQVKLLHILVLTGFHLLGQYGELTEDDSIDDCGDDENQ